MIWIVFNQQDARIMRHGFWCDIGAQMVQTYPTSAKGAYRQWEVSSAGNAKGVGSRFRGESFRSIDDLCRETDSRPLFRKPSQLGISDRALV
jgi:hypothetical protein